MAENPDASIDALEGINEGEKDLMKMWNANIRKHKFIDTQAYLACQVFIDENYEAIFHKNLMCNFLLHLTMLYDHRLIDADQKANLVVQLNSKRPLLRI